MSDVLYFGCVREIGHYLFMASETGAFKPHGKRARDLAWTRICDGGLLGEGDQVEGSAVWSYVGGYSIVSFWDRSVDKRGGSSSSFLVPGMHSLSEVLVAAGFAFPDIFERFKFEIGEAEL
jgi:hypothetical protein